MSTELGQPLRVLLVEDVATDAELELRRLADAGFRCESLRVETRDELVAALESFRPDVVLADYSLPGFDGRQAVELVRATRPDVPVIMVTGALGDETAIGLLKAGARDYVLKDNLVRLGPAVERALADEREVRSRRRAEQEVRESAETLRAMSEAAFDAIIMCDAGGRVRYWNPAATRTFGYSAADALGRELHDLLVPERHRLAARSSFALALGGGEGPAFETIREVDALCKDGAELPVEISLSRLTLGGEPAVVGICRDISARRRLEQQLREAQKLEVVGQLAGGVAHDFNNILAVIGSYAELAMDSLPPGDPMRSDLEQVRSAGERAATLTRQLLAFGRKQVLQPVVLSLNDVVGELEEMLRRTVGESIEVRLRFATNLGNVKADAAQLQQVLVNLVVNARDAMPRGGHLTVETSNEDLDGATAARLMDAPPGRYVELAVTDDGCGMDAKTRARLFEPFFTTKAPGKGSGLGLSTVYGIVRQSGGHVQVTSEPGQGTTVRVYLPRVEDAPAVMPEAHRLVRPTGGVETILLVEDDPSVRSLAVRVLRQLGYAVLVASSGQGALRIVEEHHDPIHLLLTDVVMPGMDGAELAHRLAALRPGIPALFMSGYAGDALSDKGVLEPGARILFKPFTGSDLTRAVRERLDGVPAKRV